MAFVGKALKRKEDPRFLTGRGAYADNLKLPGMLHVALVRSPFAHARIRGIDASAALARPGVVGVYTGADFEGLRLGTWWIVPNSDVVNPPYPAVATETVRFIGEPVAVVVAEDRYVADDAVEAIEVDYEPLPAVVNARDAYQPGAPQLHESAPNNRAVHYRLREGDVEGAFRNADVVSKLSLVNNRVIPASMENRVVVARYDDVLGELTAWLTTQNPHADRSGLADALGLPETKIRVIAPDVGGGFGAKVPLYAEDLVVCRLAMTLDRPLKWASTRREDCVATIHARDQITDLELAATRDGRLLGLRVCTYANPGAYLSGAGAAIPSVVYASMLSGAYQLPAIDAEVIGVFTNTVPTDAYRGAGAAMSCYAIERAMDALADDLGMDPAELRRKNYVRADQFPYDSITGATYDSGDYPAALDRALEMAGFQEFRERQTRLRASGRYLGIGLSSFVERTGFGPSRIREGAPSWRYKQASGSGAGYETAHVRVAPSGKVVLSIGVSSHGQAHDTTFAQIAADEIGVSPDDVEVVHGDTSNTPYGIGTFASRSAVVGGAATAVVSRRVQEKARRIAAHLLEAAPEDVELADGSYRVRGTPDRGVGFAEIARASYAVKDLPLDMEPGLEEFASYDPSNYAYAFGSHVCIVEVDPETGEIDLLRYIAVDDCGPQINPMVVEGQVHGALAQGIGQALWEHAAYDETGELVTASFMDYAMPLATMLPNFETAHTVTPAPHNPLGIKGVGEAGTIAAPAAVVNAVVDALSPLGVRHIEMPLTPERVWRAVRASSVE